MSYHHRPTTALFPAIIKQLATPSATARKLIYAYLIRHSEAEPAAALLSVNAMVRAAAAPCAAQRALALRVMSAIRVAEVSQIVALYLKRGAGDSHASVRRTAAVGVGKCWRLDAGLETVLVEECLDGLLGDREYHVVGAAVMAFNVVCPHRIDLIHRHYRSIMRKLVDMDEWGQLAVIKMATLYARRCFPLRTRKTVRKKENDGLATTEATPSKRLGDFYDDDEQVRQPTSTRTTDDAASSAQTEEEEEIILDPDLSLLLRALVPLLHSRNSAVVLATARTYLYLAPPPPQSHYITAAIPPLVALLRGPASKVAVALTNIVQICLAHPRPFLPYYAHFLISHLDSPATRRLKLEVLTLLFPHAAPPLRSLILAELAHFGRAAADPVLARDAVRALGRCAQAADADPATRAKCLRLLLAQLASPHSALVAESIDVIRRLIQRAPSQHRGTVVRLAKNLDTLTAPAARASIVWLVGEFAGLDDARESGGGVAADVLRILLRGFADEDEVVKMQIVLLGARVYLHWLNVRPERQTAAAAGEQETEAATAGGATTMPPPRLEEEGGGWDSEQFQNNNNNSSSSARPAEKESGGNEPVPKLWAYVLVLARYDTSYDLRDRARLYKALLSQPSQTSLASLLLLAPKPVPHVPSPGENKAGYSLGSASLVLGSEAGLGSQGVRGYEPVPAWVKDGFEPDPRLRDEEGLTTPLSSSRTTVSARERLDGALTGDKGLGRLLGKANGVKAKEKSLDDWLDEDDAAAAEEAESDEETDESSEYEEVTDSDEEEDESEEQTDDEGDEGDRDRLVP